MATAPKIQQVRTPPSRQSNPAQFAEQADAFYSDFPRLVTETNVSVEFVNQRAADADTSARSSAESQAAAQQHRQAASQSATASEAAKRDAQAAAAAAGSSAGLPAFSDNAGLMTVVNDGETGVRYTSSVRKIDVKSATATSVLDLAQSQVFRIDASSPRTLSFVNPPAANRAMTVVVHITGAEQVTFPSSVLWNNGVAPIQGGAWTTVVLLWVGTQWVGSVGAKA